MAKVPWKIYSSAQALPSGLLWTINDVCEDLHKSNKLVIGTDRQSLRFPWIFDQLTVSIFICDSSLSRLLGPISIGIQAITMEIFTWVIRKQTQDMWTWLYKLNIHEQMVQISGRSKSLRMNSNSWKIAQTFCIHWCKITPAQCVLF